MKRRLFEIIDRFHDANIAVIGDMTVDIYVYAKPHRLSREAPVVIVQYEGEEALPGGAANVVNNLWALGAQVLPIGVLGDDEAGHNLADSFPGNNVRKEGFVFEPGRATVTKTRFFAGDAHTSKQQMLRLDRETAEPLSAEAEGRVLASLDLARQSADAVIVSDYGYDVITPAVRSKLLDIAAEKTVLIDSRYRVTEFKGAAVIKPNESEARIAAGITGQSDDVYEVGRRLLDMVSTRAVVLTRGNKGMIVFEKDEKPVVVPICDTSNLTGITDVSGAGDTVASLLGLSLACGASCVEAAQLATYAAAVVVTKRGVAAATVEELLEIIEEDLGQNS
ncbi:MAG: carbohydrate kinase [Candidatus Hydrogenedentes bacterium]|nr:carbohydrate kinase [Candidatus Hydrogenedentota bacterium]